MLYQMHDMQIVVTDVHGICLSVCLSVTNAQNYPAETR